MATSLFSLLVIVAIAYTLVSVIKKKRTNYWSIGLVMYIVSFLSVSSIGLYLLVFPFVLWLLALAQSFGWIRKRWHNNIVLVIGIIIWYICIHNIDYYWLFYPFFLII